MSIKRSSGLVPGFASNAESLWSLWNEDVNNPLTTLTDLTTYSGTWSINTYLQCVVATSTQCRAFSDTPVSNASLAYVEFELEIPSTLTGSGQHIRTGITRADGDRSVSFGVRGDDKAYFELDGSAAIGTVAYTLPSTGTWIKIGLGNVGQFWVGYLDGVKVLETDYSIDTSADGVGANWYPYIGMYSTSAMTVRLRNLKAWSTNLFEPSPVTVTTPADDTPVFDLANSTKHTADTPDDEFDSTTLDVKWTAVSGTSGTVSMTERGEVEKYDLSSRPGWLLMQAGSAIGQKVELRQDFTLPDGESIVLALAPAISVENNSIINNEIWAGVAINDNDTSYDSGVYSAVFMDVQAGGYRPILYDGSTLNGLADPSPMGILQYYRLDRDGTTIYGYFSHDGVTWVPLGSVTRGTTATNLWVFAESVGAAQDPVPIQAVKWIRQGIGGAIDPWNPTARVRVGPASSQTIYAENNGEAFNASSSAFATKGNLVRPRKDMKIHGITYFGSIVDAASYRAYVIAYSGTTVSTVTGSVTYTSDSNDVATANTTSSPAIYLAFTVPVELTAGTAYLLAAGRTDSTDTYVLPSVYPTEVHDFPFSQRLPAGSGRIAKAAPAASDTIDIFATGTVRMGVEWEWA